MPTSRRAWVLACGERYWSGRGDLVAALPMASGEIGSSAAGGFVRVGLPDWAADIAVDGDLLATADCIGAGEGPAWERCDWLKVAWHMLTASHERLHEEKHGPILSYSFRLSPDLHPLFERAWVNRIFLFLRRWTSRLRGQPEAELFGSRPKAGIVLTHDVDAISLTPEIRLKQSAFHLINMGRSTLRGHLPTAASRLRDAARFAFSRGDFRTLGRVRDLERAAGLRSILHFYGGPAGLKRRSLRKMLLDPGYDVASPWLASELRLLVEGGWTVGLHQSFAAWDEAAPMLDERERVAAAAGVPVVHCRQHWLHFSWEKTWAAQQQAGLASDATLGFNDRPAFRAGHALRFQPWDFAAAAPMRLEATPMLFMDSHFYDYGQLDPSAVGAAMRRWLDEVRAVGGEVTVNWHTQTITGLYGWGGGYEELLAQLSSHV